MTNLIIKKLHDQAVERVKKELEVESANRIKKYLAASISVMVRENILTREEATAEARRYGIGSSDIVMCSTSSSDYYDTAGCYSSPPRSVGNRC